MPNLFYYLYRCCLTMWTARMKMARGGTRGKSWGSFMRECITGILGPGTAAIDAHFATTSFMTRINVFWRMQEDGPFAPSSISILIGWRTTRTPSTWRSFKIVPTCEMRCGMDQTMYAWVCLMTVELCTYGWTMLMYVYAYYLCLSMLNISPNFGKNYNGGPINQDGGSTSITHGSQNWNHVQWLSFYLLRQSHTVRSSKPSPPKFFVGQKTLTTQFKKEKRKPSPSSHHKNPHPAHHPLWSPFTPAQAPPRLCMAPHIEAVTT